MVVVMAPDATAEDVDAVVATVQAAGGSAFVSRGVHRTIVGLVGDVQQFETLNLRGLTGVTDVVRISTPYKLVSRDHHKAMSTVTVAGVPIGPGTFTLIAGPCAVETPEQTLAAARMARSAGAALLRGGAYKPRTSPYAVQGLGEKGLLILAEIRDTYGLKIVTAALDEAGVDLVERYGDMIQIGARNMQNFSLLRRVGRSSMPVLLKRGLSATLDEWLLAAEYIMSEGNYNVVLCERGVRTFAQHTRNTLDLASIPAVRRISHLPVVVDPSHGTGKNHMVIPLARAGVAVGSDGLIIEVHDQPEKALSDGAQALTLEQYDQLIQEVRPIHEVVAPQPVS